MTKKTQSSNADPTSLAIEIAARQHRGQFDKQNEPYILHPLRVMAGVTRAWKHMHPALRQELFNSGVRIEHMRAVAVLHDTVEDTGLQTAALHDAGFHQREINSLRALSRRYFKSDETYAEFIERVKLDPVAIHIKLLDLTDNMNRGRGTMSKEEHEGLLRRYASARAKLEGYLHERIEALTESA
jgi:(p)ppGpp synthase/HD superfamily hydrolase